jgi:hypothetical protein
LLHSEQTRQEAEAVNLEWIEADVGGRSLERRSHAIAAKCYSISRDERLARIERTSVRASRNATYAVTTTTIATPNSAQVGPPDGTSTFARRLETITT